MNAFTSKVMGEINSQSGTFPIAVTISLNRKLALPVFCHIASLPPKRINPGRCLLFFFRRSRSLTYEVKGALALNSLIEWVYRVIPRWQSLRSMSVGVWGCVYMCDRVCVMKQSLRHRENPWQRWDSPIPLSAIFPSTSERGEKDYGHISSSGMKVYVGMSDHVEEWLRI